MSLKWMHEVSQVLIKKNYMSYFIFIQKFYNEMCYNKLVLITHNVLNVKVRPRFDTPSCFDLNSTRFSHQKENQ